MASLAGHSLAATAILLVPLFLPEALPTPSGPGSPHVFFTDPPPPPPPPPLRYGSSRPAAKPVDQPPAKPSPPSSLTVPPETVELPQPVEAPVASDQPGAPTGTETGSLAGSEYGMEGGIAGGVPGGVPGGVLGGVIGGTGTGLVPERHYDRGPVPIRITRPVYPQDAFVKKMEGTVTLEILIGPDGRVVDAKIVRSHPLLDAAALDTVRHWVFAPAMKDGRPVAALALAPITFHIY